MCKIKISEDKEEKYELHDKLTKLIVLYFSTTTSMDEGIENCPRYDRTIQSFSASDCKIMFEFKKTDLLRLLPLLQLPDECTFDNRSKMAGEQAIMSLYLEQTSMKLRKYLDEIGRLKQELLMDGRVSMD
jgi:hypothetical protein